MARNTVGNIALGLITNTMPFLNGMNKAGKGVKRFGSSVNKARRSVGRFAAGLTAIVAGGSLVLLAKQQASVIDNLAKTSDKLGIATEALGGLRFAANQMAGVADKTLDTALQRMVRRISEASMGSGEAVKALKELGLSAYNLSRQSPDTQFAAIAEAMGKTATQADRVRLAMRLFDTEGVALVNMFKDGRNGLAAMMEEATALGHVLSRTDAAKIEAMNDALDSARKAAIGIINQGLLRIAPLVTFIAKEFVAWRKSLGDVGPFMDDFMAGFQTILGYVIPLVNGFQFFGKLIQTAMVGLGVLAATQLSAVVSEVEHIVKLFGTIPTILDNMGVVFTSALNNPLKTFELLFFRVIDSVMNGMKGVVDQSLAWAEAMGMVSFNEAVKIGVAFEGAQKNISKRIADIEKDPALAKAGQAMANIGKALQDAFIIEENETTKETREALMATFKDLVAESVKYGDTWLQSGDKMEAFVARMRAALSGQGEDDQSMAGGGDQGQTGGLIAGFMEFMRTDVVAEKLDSVIGVVKEKMGKLGKTFMEQAKRTKVSLREQVDGWGGFFSDIATAAEAGGKRFVGIMKIASLAAALLNAYSAIASAYAKGSELGGPYVGAAFAVAAGLAQFATIAKMRSVDYGTTSGSASVTSGAPTVDLNNDAVSRDEQQSQTVNFQITGTGDRITRVLAEEMQKAQKRGTATNINGRGAIA